MGKRKAFTGIDEKQFNCFAQKRKFFSNSDVHVFQDGQFGTQVLKTGPFNYPPKKSEDRRNVKKIKKATEIAIPYVCEGDEDHLA